MSERISCIARHELKIDESNGASPIGSHWTQPVQLKEVFKGDSQVVNQTDGEVLFEDVVTDLFTLLVDLPLTSIVRCAAAAFFFMLACRIAWSC